MPTIDLSIISVVLAVFVSTGLYFTLDATDTQKKYNFLKPLLLTTLIWSFFSVFNFLGSEFLSYKTTLMNSGFTFLTLYFASTALMSFEGQKIKKELKILAMMWTFLLFLMALTNHYHFLLLEVSQENFNINEGLARGEIFYIHAFVSYSMILLIIAKVFTNKKSESNQEIYKPFQLIFVFIIGVALNIINNNFIHISLNLNLFVMVGFVIFIYISIYRGDVHFSIVKEGRRHILRNMKEMYILTDENENLIEISENLKERFILGEKTRKREEVIKEIEKHTILYEHINDLKEEKEMKTKPYFLTQKKEFSIDNKRGFLTLFYDETKTLRLIKELNYLRKFDNMTDVYNRNHLEENKKHLEKNNPNFGIIMLDLDGLKETNDKKGHDKGDTLIISFAKNLNTITKESEKIEIFRYGGDEFLIFIHDLKRDPLEKIVKSIKKSIQKNNPEILYSIGISEKNKNIEETIKIADKNLYKDKKNKKEG